MVFDEDKANARCSRMWRKLAGLYERAAYEAADKGQLETALDAARRAEVCFWQATGGMDCTLMKELISDNDGRPF